MGDFMIVPGRGKVRVSNSLCGEAIHYSTEKDRDYTPRHESMYERTKAQVYATGNKWAIENFHATHD